MCRAQYANLEIMIHAFKQQVINLSKADIRELRIEGISQAEFEKFISQQDKYSDYQQQVLSDKVQML